MVIAIASEEKDTEFESPLSCLLRDREILRMRSQSATRKKKTTTTTKNKKQKKNPKSKNGVENYTLLFEQNLVLNNSIWTRSQVSACHFDFFFFFFLVKPLRKPQFLVPRSWFITSSSPFFVSLFRVQRLKIEDLNRTVEMAANRQTSEGCAILSASQLGSTFHIVRP